MIKTKRLKKALLQLLESMPARLLSEIQEKIKIKIVWIRCHITLARSSVIIIKI